MRSVLLGLIILASASTAAHAQWSIGWQTVDAGGATELTGGAWSMTASVGQPDTGRVEALDLSFSLEGGYWAGVTPYPPGDYDSSGFMDSDDYVAFVADFQRGCVGPGQSVLGPDPLCQRSADFDRSGSIDSDDFVAFVAVFQGP
jgi:hypothetical protein